MCGDNDISLPDQMAQLHGVINGFIDVNTKHLYNICTTSAQRLRRWSDVIQMLYKRFVGTDLRPVLTPCV